MAVDEAVAAPLSAPEIRVQVIALLKAREPGVFAYLQGMRSGRLQRLGVPPEETQFGRRYLPKVPKFAAMLAEAVQGEISAVLSPRSDHAWQAQPYREAITAAHPEATDLTERLTRTGPARSGKGASLGEVLAGLGYEPTGREATFRRIVIDDDTFTTGTTAAAADLLGVGPERPADAFASTGCLCIKLDAVLFAITFKRQDHGMLSSKGK